jgi:hypothetical protein
MSTIASVGKCVIQNGIEWMQHIHVDRCADVLGLIDAQTVLIAALCSVILVPVHLVQPKSIGMVFTEMWLHQVISSDL